MATTSTKIQLQAEISASSNGLISALKQASGAINDTTQSWSSKFSKLKDSTSLISQSVKNLGDLFGKVGNEAGMEQMSSRLGEIQTVFSKVQNEVSEFSAQLSALKNNASDLGMPVEDYQRFADAIANANLSMEQGQSAIVAMKKNILDLANGVPEAQALFNQLGLSIEQLSSNSVMGNFGAIAQALQATVPPTEQARASMQLFGATMQDTLHVSQEYSRLLANQGENAYASDRDVQNAISLAGALQKVGDTIVKLEGAETKGAQATDAFNRSYKELFDTINASRNELTDLYATYASYVDGLKRTVTSAVDSSTALRVFSENVSDLSKSLEDYLDVEDELNAITGEEDIAMKRLGELVGFVSKTRQKIEEEMVSVVGIMHQRIDAGAPVDTKELDTALDHISMLRDAYKSLDGTIKEFQNSGKSVPQEMLDEVDGLGSLLEEFQGKLASLASRSFELNLSIDTSLVDEELDTISQKMDEIKDGGGISLDSSELDVVQEKLDTLRSKAQAVRNLDDSLKPEDTSSIDQLQTRLDGLRKTFTDLAYEASKNPFEKLWDGARKLGTALRHPIRSTETLRDRLRTLGASGLKNAQIGVVELGKAFIHPIDQCRKLVAKMDEFVASTHRAQAGVQAIGNGSGNLAKNMGVTARDAKQALGQMVGMGGKLGFLVWAGRTFLGTLKMWVSNFTEAAKHAREIQEIMSRQQSEVAQGNANRADSLAGDLKRYAELREKASNGSATDRNEMQKLQKEIEAKYGIDLKNGAKEFREAFQWADNMKRDAIESQIASLEKLNKTLKDEDTELQSTWKNILNHGLSASGWKQVYDRRTEIAGSVSENSTKIAELREQLRVEQGKNGFNDWKSAENAKKQDELKKAREDQRKALDEATKKLNEWSQSINDTDRQKNLREIMAKYSDAVKAGVKEETARKVAVQAVTQMLKKEKEDEQKKNEELVKAMDECIKQYKSAYEAYIRADKAVLDAKQDYARTQRQLADENRSERLSKRRERIQRQMGRFGFTPFEGFKFDESSSERRERRRNNQLDASIAEKMAKAQAGDRVHWTRGEKERLGEYQRLQRKDRQLEASQKAMEAAEKQAKAADALNEAAKAIREAVLGRADAGKNLREAGKDLREANGRRRTTSRNLDSERVFEGAKRSLSARGVGSAMQQRSQGYNGQLDLLHRDLQDLNKRIYIVR